MRLGAEALDGIVHRVASGDGTAGRINPQDDGFHRIIVRRLIQFPG